MITRRHCGIYTSTTAAGDSERGSILVLALVILTAVAGFTMALMTVAVSGENSAAINTRKITAQNLAEGAVENGKQWIQTQWANQAGASVAAKACDNVHALVNPAAWTSVTVAGYPAKYAIVKVSPTLTPTPAPTAKAQITPDTLGWYVDGNDGVRTFFYLYAVYGKAEFKPKASSGDSSSVASSISKVVKASITPLFQYAVFYNSDLEILPGPNMTLTGRVHSNRDMYLGTGATLTMDTDYVRAVGKLYRKRKDDNTPSTGTVLIRNLANSSNASSADDFQFNLPTGAVSASKLFSQTELSALGISTPQGFDSTFGGYDYNGNGSISDARDWKPWATQAMSFWGGTVQTSDMDVQKAEPPTQNTTIDPYVPKAGGDYVPDGSGGYTAVTPGTGTYSKGFYHSNAGLQIRDGVMYAPDGSALTSCLVSGTLSTQSVYDAREGKSVPQTVIDIQKLNQTMQQTGLSGAAATALGKMKTAWNGLVYATTNNATASAPKGLLVKNGSELPNNPLTNAATGLSIATNLPIYIQGDYNTKVNGVSSSTNDPAYRKPASVIADAVNLLSNAWNNSKTSSSGLPAATDTTYNTAMIAGGTESVPPSGSAGTYCGGLENLPRFHEDWAGPNKKATIAGSFVNLWKSKIAKSAWVYGSPKYTAPTRIWDFDPNYKTYSKLPPFTPIVVQMSNVCTQ